MAEQVVLPADLSGPKIDRTVRGQRNRIEAASVISWRTVSGLSNKEFEKLAVPLMGPLYNFACWLCSDPEEANDLVQETFVKSLKALGTFQAGTNLRSWMFRILHNTFLSSRTGLQHKNTVQDEDGVLEAAPETGDTPERALIRRADTALVQEAIASLPIPFREVILLADIEEMKYQEIAATLDIPIGTVMSRLSRARGQVRKHITSFLGAKTAGAKS